MVMRRASFGVSDMKKGDTVWVKGTVHTMFKNGVVRVSFPNSDPTSPAVNPDHKWARYRCGASTKFAAVTPDLIREDFNDTDS